jgi:hypothetical protein
LRAAGCMLFWAEGSKARNHAEIVNADPEVIRLFAKFLRAYFDVPDEKFRVACNLFADHLEKQREIEDFWLAVVGVPRTCLTKTMVNRYSPYSKKKRRNKLHLRDVPGNRRQHPDRPAPLRSNPGVRTLRA